MSQDMYQGNQGLIRLGEQFATFLPIIMELLDRNRLRNDPTLNALQNDLIGQSNYLRGRGGPLGDPDSGYGGALGQDAAGNPLNPVGAYVRHLTGQYGAGAQNFQGVQDQHRELAARYGIGMPETRLSLGPEMGFDPGAVRGVEQGLRPEPTMVGPIQTPRQRRQDWFQNLFGRKGEKAQGSYAVGTTSVPKTGTYQLHAGEAVVPAQMNPAAGTPGRPLLGQGNYAAMTPGLNPQAQGAIISRGQEAVDAGAANLQRQLREQAGAGGQVNSGALARRQFDAELGRLGSRAGITRDVGIAAAERNFGDTLQMNQFELARALGEGELSLGQGRLGLDAELGRGRLGLDTRALAQQGELARRELALGENRLGLDSRLGNRDLDLRGQGLALERQLGMGRLGLDRQGQEYDRDARQQALWLERDLGQQRIGLDSRALAQQGELGRGRLGLDSRALDYDRELGLGRLGVDRDRLGLDRENTLGRLGLDRERLDVERDLGLRDREFRDRSFDADFGRGLLGDTQDQYRWEQERRDRQMQQLLELYMGGQGMQGESLERLLEIFSAAA